MKISELKEALQLDADADESAVLSACRDLRQQRDAAVAQRDTVYEALALSADVTREQVEARLMTLTNPPDRVPAEQFSALQQQLAELQSQLDHKHAAERVAQAMSAGKITEHQRDWALTLALKDPESFEAWVSAAPVVITTGRLTSPVANGASCERAALIARARTTYRQAREEGLRVCSLSAWINDELRQNGMSPLTQQESGGALL